MIYHAWLLFFAVGVLAEDKRPNFVVILTDDQDVVLDGMKPMKNVEKFLTDEGMSFSNSFVVSPICCPSRASVLTGMYIHNHQTYNNSFEGGCSGAEWLKKHEKHTFATVLNDAGYNTFYAGKYLNEYGFKAAGGTEHVPPGWTEWHGLVGNSVYYNYTLSNDGVATFSNDLYLTDVIRDLSVSFIEKQKESRPFMMVMGTPAPHSPFTPAPRHSKKYEDVSALHTPNFNITPVNKHWLMNLPPVPLPSYLTEEMDSIYRRRWETLVAVDEMVADVVATLDRQNLLDNTYVIYTSDNGYHVGQFSQVNDKRQPYESDIRVPLVIRGPGIEKDSTSDVPVLNIDLAPTMISLAGLRVPSTMDGHPIKFGDTRLAERHMLIEYSGEGYPNTVAPECEIQDSYNFAYCHVEHACKCEDTRNNTYACIRHLDTNIDTKYCQFYDDDMFVEMYNLHNDPYELDNIIDSTLPSIRHFYDYVLRRMIGCQGANSCDHPLEPSQRRSNNVQHWSFNNS